MVGGPDYLASALAGTPPQVRSGTSVDEYRAGVAGALDGYGAGCTDRTCPSPMGFEWTVGKAVAGTFMDQLIHTWDLATATGQDATLDAISLWPGPRCSTTFLAGCPRSDGPSVWSDRRS